MIDITLAVGETGKHASLVKPTLVAGGAKACGQFRDSEASDLMRARGAAEVATGDLRDRPSLDHALDRVTSVFYIAPAFLTDDTRGGEKMVKATIKARAKRSSTAASTCVTGRALSEPTEIEGTRS